MVARILSCAPSALFILTLFVAVVSFPLQSQEGNEQGEGAAPQETTNDSVADDEEDEVRVEENVFTPSEEISQDNAVPFPIDI